MVIILAGILPFGSIFIETYFVLTSFWAPNKTYYVYGFMLLVFIILLIVTSCVSIVTTCLCEAFLIQLTSSLAKKISCWIAKIIDGTGRISWLVAARVCELLWILICVAGYVFIYSIYYFYFKYGGFFLNPCVCRTKMYGLYQTVSFFSFMGLACFGIFLGTAAVGHLVSGMFLRRIYSNVKIDWAERPPKIWWGTFCLPHGNCSVRIKNKLLIGFNDISNGILNRLHFEIFNEH